MQSMNVIHYSLTIYGKNKGTPPQGRTSAIMGETSNRDHFYTPIDPYQKYSCKALLVIPILNAYDPSREVHFVHLCIYAFLSIISLTENSADYQAQRHSMNSSAQCRTKQSGDIPPFMSEYRPLQSRYTESEGINQQDNYRHPSDVDLWSGGVSERPLPGSMVGPTFGCIIATQFSYSRRGDRFWYELGNQPSSFTPEQLQEIRKVKLSRVICDNTDLIDTIQIYPMVLPDHEM